MSMTLLGILGLLSLMVLLGLRFPVALSMILVGVIGTIFATTNKFYLVGMDFDRAFDRGIRTAMSNLSGEAFEAASNYNLLVIPMFVLMGNLAGVSGMSADLFNAAYRWMGHLRGGLASATIAACAGFAALSGSSLAAAITMGRVALPEMKKFKYSDSLATGSVAAGGTLGFLIPPSGGMVIYAVLTEQSIGRLVHGRGHPGDCADLAVHRCNLSNRAAQARGGTRRDPRRPGRSGARRFFRHCHFLPWSGSPSAGCIPGSLPRSRRRPSARFWP